jgi:putative ABC transport system permease protein
MCLTVRSPHDAAGLTRDVERKLWAIDSALPPTDVLSMTDVVQASVSPQRFNLTLLTIFAAVALALAAIGIYGVVAYSVTQRTHEIGVRVAIGAQRADILRMVMGEGARLAAIGTAAGLLGAALLTNFIAGMLFGVDAQDPATFAGVAIVLGFAAAAASYVPARRAMRVDPMVALRHE